MVGEFDAVFWGLLYLAGLWLVATTSGLSLRYALATRLPHACTPLAALEGPHALAAIQLPLVLLCLSMRGTSPPEVLAPYGILLLAASAALVLSPVVSSRVRVRPYLCGSLAILGLALLRPWAAAYAGACLLLLSIGFEASLLQCIEEALGHSLSGMPVALRIPVLSAVLAWNSALSFGLLVMAARGTPVVLAVLASAVVVGLILLAPWGASWIGGALASQLVRLPFECLVRLTLARTLGLPSPDAAG